MHRRVNCWMARLMMMMLVVAGFSITVYAQEPADADRAEQPAAADGQPQEKPAQDAPPADEAKPDEAQKEEAKPDEALKDEAKSDDAQKEEAKKNDGKKDDAKKPKAEKDDQPQPLPTFGYSDTPMIPGQPWRVHDVLRPRPRVITPGQLSTYEQPGTAPSDAVVLFDGQNLDQWAHQGPEGPADLRVPQWKVQDGYMEIVPRSGSLRTIDSFGSCQLHVEWAAPQKVSGHSQGRGNSGVLLMGEYEVQVLDSYNNRTYADGQAGALYGQYPPMVNASRPPGEWQVYDIIFEAPRFDLEGNLLSPAFVSVVHNGVLLHHRRQMLGPSSHKHVPQYDPQQPAAPLQLQDHGNPVRYRNIWIRPLDFD